ncbi:hypothetical protein [Streptomyces sp. NPDC004042]|uniref:hypothetical protein n=1 Tax=Streptomyces sp. NPDC004042 TaxID=3154451 RepID=UPI0033B8B540
MSAAARTNVGGTALGPVELQGITAVMSLLAQAGRADGQRLNGLLAPGSQRLHLGYSEAAERLNVPEKWLRERISTLPHRKFGKFVQFTEEDLLSISDMHFVNPGKPAQEDHESSLMALQPSKRSRKRF